MRRSDKTASLGEAIRLNVKPGMQLFISFESGASIAELLRQFRNKRPGFTVITTIVADHLLNLIHCGLIKKLIFANCAELYPSASPSKVLQRAFKNRRIILENWSLYSLHQRLLAGALDVDFLPTKSVIGSSLAEENNKYFKVVNSPFDATKKVGVVSALHPDISIIHSWAADRRGNVITLFHSQDTVWGAKASKKGILVTVENIVSTDFIRKYSTLVKIPGYRVLTVSLARMGAHPQSQIAPGITRFKSYTQDYDFMAEYREATSDETLLDLWLSKWILGCKNHKDYLKRLGTKRLTALRVEGTVCKDRKHEKLRTTSAENANYNESEMMLVIAKRKIVEKVIKHGYQVILVGVGFPSLVGWPAYYELRSSGYQVELMVGSGLFGYDPAPGDPFFLNSSVVKTCKMLTDVIESYGVIVGGYESACVSILGGGQIDKNGNINSARVSKDIYLTGAGGANDNSSGAKEVLAIIKQSKKRLLEKVPFVTSCGKNIKTLVSTMGVYEKIGSSKQFTLTGYFPYRDWPKEALLQRIRDNCSWTIDGSRDIRIIEPPTAVELKNLRKFDPKRLYMSPGTNLR